MSVCCYYLCLSVLQCSFCVCGCCVRELTGAAAARIELIPFRVSHNSMKYTTYLQGALGVWQQPLSLIFLLFVCVSVYYSLSLILILSLTISSQLNGFTVSSPFWVRCKKLLYAWLLVAVRQREDA